MIDITYLEHLLANLHSGKKIPEVFEDFGKISDSVSMLRLKAISISRLEVESLGLDLEVETLRKKSQSETRP